MATLESLASDIDAQGGWGDIIESLQSQSKAANGCYSQLLPSHTSPPSMNSPTAPDNLAAVPHDRAGDAWCSWSNVMANIDAPDLWRFSVRSDCVGPFGADPDKQGWDTIFETVDDDGVLWRRVLRKRNGQARTVEGWVIA